MSEHYDVQDLVKVCVREITEQGILDDDTARDVASLFASPGKRSQAMTAFSQELPVSLHALLADIAHEFRSPSVGTASGDMVDMLSMLKQWAECHSIDDRPIVAVDTAYGHRFLSVETHDTYALESCLQCGAEYALVATLNTSRQGTYSTSTELPTFTSDEPMSCDDLKRRDLDHGDSESDCNCTKCNPEYV